MQKRTRRQSVQVTSARSDQALSHALREGCGLLCICWAFYGWMFLNPYLLRQPNGGDSSVFCVRSIISRESFNSGHSEGSISWFAGST